MEISTFAERILFGTSVQDKLACPDDLSSMTDLRPGPRIGVPTFPGRPADLLRPGKAEFPSLEALRDPKTRGEVLHFFANHELLALELMALVLLRFPEAPTPFRMTMVRTIQEEQSHMRLYLDRMRELGVGFGDLPLSDYFWNMISPTRSLMDFVTQMSLTLEQANLDFSAFYKIQIEKTGDTATAGILERVFQDEIGHVKNGVAWFNRWRENSENESDWDAYQRLLPLPMTPRRAKGIGFCADARRQAGLSETFIRELEIHSGSKGRPPIVWSYNPLCDAEIARGSAGFTPTDSQLRVIRDLEHLLLFLASDQDLVLTSRRPTMEWIKKIQAAGFPTAQLLELSEGKLNSAIRDPKLGGFQPWGWSPVSFEGFKPLSERLVPVSGGNAKWLYKLFAAADYSQTGLGRIFSKAWSADFLREWLKSHPETTRLFVELEDVGLTYDDANEAVLAIQTLLASGKAAILKAPWETSGTQLKRVYSKDDLDPPLTGWIRNIIESQKCLVVERLLPKLADLSMQLEIGDESVELLPIRCFMNGSRLEFKGTHLGHKLGGLTKPAIRFLNSDTPHGSPIELWRSLAMDLGRELQCLGYRGPAGVDALLYEENGKIRLKPLVELNPRWTMGRVALEIEKHLQPGAMAQWRFISLREAKELGHASLNALSQSLDERFPLKVEEGAGGLRIRDGVLFTNDPELAQEVLTVLLVGEDATKAI